MSPTKVIIIPNCGCRTPPISHSHGILLARKPIVTFRQVSSGVEITMGSHETWFTGKSYLLVTSIYLFLRDELYLVLVQILILALYILTLGFHIRFMASFFGVYINPPEIPAGRWLKSTCWALAVPRRNEAKRSEAHWGGVATVKTTLKRCLFSKGLFFGCGKWRFLGKMFSKHFF